MKKHTIKLFLLTSCLSASTFIKAQGDKIISDSAIKKSIQIYANLVDSQDLQEFGLKSIAELKSLKAGKQFKKYMIGLNDIKTFKQGDDVRKIIKEYSSIEVSLVNQVGIIRTSIQFVKNNNQWKVSGFGSTPELIILTQAQTALPENVIKKGMLIRIPALQISFIALPSSAAQLEFFSLEDKPYLKLKKGEKMPAAAAILRLVPLALKHNGKPT